MKNVKIRVRESCSGSLWDYAIYEAKRQTRLVYTEWYTSKSAAVRGAKAMAERIGIKYDPEIINRYGC